MQKKSVVIRLLIYCCLLLIGTGVFAQSKKTKNSKNKNKTQQQSSPVQTSPTGNTAKPIADSVNHKQTVDNGNHKPAADSVKLRHLIA